MYDIIELSRKLLPDLREIAKELDIKKVESFKKQDLIYKILDTQAILASEKKTEDKKLKSPRDIVSKREESSVFNKLFNRKKEEKPAETKEMKPAEPQETEKQETSVPNTDQKQEGKRELQIKKRPRTEHVKAGSSNPNTNQKRNQRPNNNNPNQRTPFRPEQPENEAKQDVQPKQNQNQKVRQEILFAEEPIDNDAPVESIEVIDIPVIS